MNLSVILSPIVVHYEDIRRQLKNRAGRQIQGVFGLARTGIRILSGPLQNGNEKLDASSNFRKYMKKSLSV